MSVKLIYPPFSEPSIRGPHLAAHLLASILIQDGIQAIAFDLNIRFVRKITEKKYVKKAIEILKNRKDSKLLRKISSLENFLLFTVDDYSKYSADGLINVLGILKKCFFEELTTFENCISEKCFTDSFITDIYKQLIDEIKIEECDIIGFSVAFAEQFPSALHLAKIIKQQFPNIRIIIGGSQISLFNSTQIDILKNLNIFHTIVRGDGDIIITKLVNDILSEQQPEILQSGISGKNKFLELPTPVFKETNQYFGRLQIPIIVTKGCYWGKCSFCDYIQLSNLGHVKYLERDPVVVLKEISTYQKNFPNAVFNLISDAVPPLWYQKLCNLAIETKCKLHTWSYILHSKILNRSMFELFAKAGIHSITFGTESLLDRQLKILNKNSSAETVKNNLKDSSGLGFSVIMNIIPDIPSTTVSEALKLIKEIEKISTCIRNLNIQKFALTSGTNIAENPENYGIKISQSNSIKTSHGFHSLEFTDLYGMSDIEREKVFSSIRHLAMKIRLSNFVKPFFSKDFSDENIIIFDPTLILLKHEKNEIYSGFHHVTYSIEDWEYGFFKNIFKIPDRKITLAVLRNIFIKYNSNNGNSFTKYFLQILKMGLIVKIET